VQQLSVAGPRPIDSAQNDQTKTWLESKLYNLSQGKIETDVVGSRESIPLTRWRIRQEQMMTGQE
ncbi:MAG: hypothetical protein ACW968_07290, partial [Candidatus Thorarchaeota archaeon]